LANSSKRFSYTYRDLARLLGISEDAVRQDAARGNLKSDDGLEGLVSYLDHRGLVEMGRIIEASGASDESED